jgi:hypothetical protein
MKKLLLLLVAVCALLATSSSAFAASPAAYRAKVNGICKVGVAKINAVPAPASPKGYAAYFDAEARLGYQLLKQIIEVTPPKSLQPLVLNAIRPQGKVVDGVSALAARIRKGANPAKAAKAATPALDRLTRQADAAWRKAGLNACAG